MTESQLLTKVKGKNRAAQELLYDRYKNLWFSICLRYSKHESDALDVLQNALVKIYTKIHQFDMKRGDFKSWSSKIVVNENLMYIRKKSHAFITDELEEGYNIYDNNEGVHDILNAEELTKMVQNLPDGYRTIFNLYVIEGYSHGEISEILNITVGTSKSQLFKARKLLQQKLEVLI